MSVRFIVVRKFEFDRRFCRHRSIWSVVVRIISRGRRLIRSHKSNYDIGKGNNVCHVALPTYLRRWVSSYLRARSEGAIIRAVARIPEVRVLHTVSFYSRISWYHHRLHVPSDCTVNTTTAVLFPFFAGVAHPWAFHCDTWLWYLINLHYREIYISDRRVSHTFMRGSDYDIRSTNTSLDCVTNTSVKSKSANKSMR